MQDLKGQKLGIAEEELVAVAVVAVGLGGTKSRDPHSDSHTCSYSSHLDLDSHNYQNLR